MEWIYTNWLKSQENDCQNQRKNKITNKNFQTLVFQNCHKFLHREVPSPSAGVLKAETGEESPGRKVSESCQALCGRDCQLSFQCKYILPFFSKKKKKKQRTMIPHEAAIPPVKNLISQSLPVKQGHISKFRTKSCEWMGFA